MFPSYMSECLPVSLMPDTHFLCLDFFFALVCCYMYPSTYLSHSYTQCLLYVPISLSLSPSPSDFTSLCRYSMYTIVFVCLSHSCHMLVSTLTVHINLLNCVVTHVSLIARPPGCLFVFCIVAHLSVLLSSITFSTYYHHFFYHKVGLRCCRFAYTITTSTSADLT